MSNQILKHEMDRKRSDQTNISMQVKKLKKDFPHKIKHFRYDDGYSLNKDYYDIDINTQKDSIENSHNILIS